jgi:hypothetical protein
VAKNRPLSPFLLLKSSLGTEPPLFTLQKLPSKFAKKESLCTFVPSKEEILAQLV